MTVFSSPSPHAQHRVHVAVAIWFSGSLDLKQLVSRSEDCMGMLGKTNEKLSHDPCSLSRTKWFEKIGLNHSKLMSKLTGLISCVVLWFEQVWKS